MKEMKMRLLMMKQHAMGKLHMRHKMRRVNSLFRQLYHRDINLTRPEHFVEKLRWLQFNTDTRKWTRLADKQGAKEYVAEMGLGEIVVPTLGLWSRAKDIDFDALPEAFVLKTTHSSGDIAIVESKNRADRKALRRKFALMLRLQLGNHNIETHYQGIKPRVLAEPILKNDAGFSTSIVDYKFFCFKGEPVACEVCYNRDMLTHYRAVMHYDMEWQSHPQWLKGDLGIGDDNLPEPKSFEKMKEYCRILAADLPFVRLDFYEVDGKPYFGEFTFSPDAYKLDYMSDELLEMLASKLDLNDPQLKTTDNAKR